MENSFSFKDDSISSSNGLTSVLLTTIGLSGSYYAVDEDEKNLIIWIMTQDQSCMGIGTVGFDLTELPWKKEKFGQQKAFLFKTLEGVKNKIGWETLNYTPNEGMLFEVVCRLSRMLEQMTVEEIDENHTYEWLAINEDDEEDEGMIQAGYPKCEKHKILLSVFGCMACNDKY